MVQPANIERWAALEAALEAVQNCRDLDAVLTVLRDSARAIADADGIAVVRRDGDHVVYVGEDAISPLWTGQRFAIDACVSGHALRTGEPLLVPDIRNDARVPLNLYLATFVQSLAIFPIGFGEPVAALCAYWRRVQPIDPEAVALLTLLARAAGGAFEASEARRIVRSTIASAAAH